MAQNPNAQWEWLKAKPLASPMPATKMLRPNLVKAMVTPPEVKPSQIMEKVPVENLREIIDPSAFTLKAPAVKTPATTTAGKAPPSTKGFAYLQPTTDNNTLVTQANVFNELVMMNRLNWLALITQTNLPATGFGATMTGDKIGTTDKYLLLHENKSPNPIGVRIAATFSAVTGKQVKLSLTDASDDGGAVDYLGNSANAPSFNKRISDTIVLGPNQRLYINTADTAFALVVGDVFRVRVLDPGMLAGASWEIK